MIQYKDIQTDRYIIKCKYFLPDTKTLNGIVIGIHGFAGDKESSALSKLADTLMEQGKGLVCFDFPCHGTSPAGEEQFSIENCIKDVLFMADLCRKNYPHINKYIFATSFGGFITLLCSSHLKDFNTVLRAPAVTMPNHILMDILQMTPEEFKMRGTVPCGVERTILLPFSFYEELQQYDVFQLSYENEMRIIHGSIDDVVPIEESQKIFSYSLIHDGFALLLPLLQKQEGM